MLRLLLLLAILVSSPLAFLYAGDANRLTYLDDNSPYFPSGAFPKLVTPQWVGLPKVEAVVILSVNDLGAPEKTDAYIAPIVARLKQIEGRAPLSLMICGLDPQSPLVRRWMADGLSLEVRPTRQSGPLLQAGDFGAARTTFDRCLQRLNDIAGNRPVGSRLPGCESFFAASPRFYAELFNTVNDAEQFLELDSSVCNLLTAHDPQVPRHLADTAEGRGRFKKYGPENVFINIVHDYPYPYIIQRMCWEIPCAVPSGGSTLRLEQPHENDLLADLQAALDIVVVKRGVYTLSLQPNGGISSDQAVRLIEHAVRTHGPKVKFLTFREVRDRLTNNLLAGHALRSKDGQDNGVRLLDIDNDGYQDVAIGNEAARLTRIWKPETQTWHECQFPTPFIQVDLYGKHHDAGVHFGVTRPDGHATVLVSTPSTRRAWFYGEKAWELDQPLRELLRHDQDNTLTSVLGRDRGGRLRDIDHDGCCELIVSSPTAHGIHRLNPQTSTWELLPFSLPEGTRIANLRGRDAGLRFQDINGDGFDDVLFSNDRQYSIHLWASPMTGWTGRTLSGIRGEQPAIKDLPMFSREGTDNGAWFRDRHLWVQNEDTSNFPNGLDRRSFKDLLSETK